MTPGKSEPSEPPPADSRPLLSSLQERACLELDLEPGSSSDAARTAFLRRLAARDFLPHRHEREAFDLLAGSGPAPSSSSLVEEVRRGEDDRRDEVEAFAAAFFSIPTSDRRGRWQRLREACAGCKPLRNRLQKLEPGLGIDPAGFSDRSPEIERLGQGVFSLFVLPARLEAIRRQELVAALKTNPPTGRGGWRAVVLQFWKRHPHVASLAPLFLSQVAQSPAILARPVRKPPVVSAPTSASGSKPFFRSGWAIYVVIMIAGAFIRAMGTFPSGTTPPITPTITLPSNISADDPFVGTMKNVVRSHFAQAGKPLGEADIDAIAQQFSITASLGRRLDGNREPVTFKTLTARLDLALQGKGITLQEPELSTLARKCFPFWAAQKNQDSGSPAETEPSPSFPIPAPDVRTPAPDDDPPPF